MKNLIKSKVNELIDRHNTADPYELANAEGIIILKENLGGIFGYYSNQYRQKIIHINSEIPEKRQLTTCAHELGHAILHPDSNTSFLRENTFCSINKLERQANLFAAELLIDDNKIKEYKSYNLEQIALIENLPIELLKLKFL